MSWFIDFYRSAVGKKAIMALTGVALFGFVLIHMAGNLKLYMGAEAINHYGEWLREVGEPLFPKTGVLWIFRVGLVVLAALHITSATQLTLESRRARPTNYAERRRVKATYASRTMRWGGVIIALFVLYHLGHFTLGWVHPDFIAGDVYHNVVVGFSVPWVAGFYIVANLMLGFHLYHGLWSMFQSVGWHGERERKDWRQRFAQVFAVVITVGNVSFPVSVLTGIVGG